MPLSLTQPFTSMFNPLLKYEWQSKVSSFDFNRMLYVYSLWKKLFTSIEKAEKNILWMGKPSHRVEIAEWKKRIKLFLELKLLWLCSNESHLHTNIKSFHEEWRHCEGEATVLISLILKREPIFFVQSQIHCVRCCVYLCSESSFFFFSFPTFTILKSEFSSIL